MMADTPVNTLTKEALNTIKDDELVQTVFDKLIGRLPQNSNDWFMAVTKWNKSEKAIFLSFILDGQVNNGGFNQYYFNIGTQYNDFLAEAFRTIGDNNIALLVEEANHLSTLEENSSSNNSERTLENFADSYDDNPFDSLDSKYYTITENNIIEKLQTNYIRKNIEDFVGK